MSFQPLVIRISAWDIYNTLLIANEILDHEIIFIVSKESDLGFEKIAEMNYDVRKQNADNIIEDILALDPDVVINAKVGYKCIGYQTIEDAGITLINLKTWVKVFLMRTWSSTHFILRRR